MNTGKEYIKNKLEASVCVCRIKVKECNWKIRFLSEVFPDEYEAVEHVPWSYLYQY